MGTLVPAAFSSPEQDVKDPNMESSDVWGMYFSNMGGHTAMTVFDDGIAERINALELPNSIKIKLHLEQVREDGLPTTNEGDRLMVLGPIVEDVINDNGGLFLGRVTTNGVRWNIGLAPEDTANMEARLEQASIEHWFRYDVFIEPDPDKAAYWDDLYPSDDDRQVMQDMQVMDSLRSHGDDQNAVRKVDHWSYFDDADSARQFAEWLTNEGYESVKAEKQKSGLFAKPTWRVTNSHDGTMLLTISPTTPSNFRDKHAK